MLIIRQVEMAGRLFIPPAFLRALGAGCQAWICGVWDAAIAEATWAV